MKMALINSVFVTTFLFAGVATDYAGMDWNYGLISRGRTVRIALQVSDSEGVFPKTNFTIRYFKGAQKLGFEIKTIGPLRFARGLHFNDFPSSYPAATRIEISAKEAPAYNPNALQSDDRNSESRDIVAQAARDKSKTKAGSEELELERLEKSQQVPPGCQWLGNPQNMKQCLDNLNKGEQPPKDVTRSDCAVPLSPADLVAQAEIIVRAKAEVLVPSQAASSQVQFSVLELLKGQNPPAPLVFDGSFGGDNPAPQNSPVPRILATNAKLSCFAQIYSQNQEFLLFLKKGTSNQLELYWSPQSAVNEQISGSKDPWLIWVKQALTANNSR